MLVYVIRVFSFFKFFKSNIVGLVYPLYALFILTDNVVEILVQAKFIYIFSIGLLID